MVTVYTLLGGIEAVIWTDVAQSIVLSVGALLACALIVSEVPGGIAAVLDAWWTLSGAFAGGVLGLFLLGQIVRRADRVAAAIGVTVGVLVILWLTLMSRLPEQLSFLHIPIHSNLTIVVGTLVIFAVGLGVSRWRTPGDEPADPTP